MNQLQIPGQQPQLPVPAPFTPVQLGLSDESKVALLDHWRTITKRKWPILGLALVFAVLAAAIGFAMTPIYRSTATILIESGKAKVLSIDDATGSMMQGKEYYQTQVEVLKSRDVTLRMIKKLELWNHPDYDPRKAESSMGARLKAMVGLKSATEWNDDTLAEAVLEMALPQISIEPVRLSQLVKVNFDSVDKNLAARAANELAAAYIDADRESKLNTAQSLNGWLEERADALLKKLEESEAALQKYREEQGLIDLGGSAQGVAKIEVGEVAVRLVAARTHRVELEAAYKAISSIKNGDYSSIPVVVANYGVAEAMKRSQELESQLIQLSSTNGPNSPKVQELENAVQKSRIYIKELQYTTAKSLIQEYNSALSAERSLEEALKKASGSVMDVNRKEFDLTVLQREATTNQNLYMMFMERAKELNAASDLAAPIARVVDTASPAKVPLRPNKVQLVMVAMIIGLMLGSAGALGLEQLDNTVKGSESAEAKLHQPVLTVLPMLEEVPASGMSTMFLNNPTSHHAEAIRTARTGVMLSGIDAAHRVILVTSSVPGEGKTSFSTNLALSLAQTKRTLLIDADMRAPQVGTRFGLEPGAKGLSNLVAGSASLKECVHKVEGSPLMVVPAGDIPPNPLELLLSQRFKDVLTKLQDQVDFIVIDSPPVELVSDALVLAPVATGTIYVIRAMKTPYPLARKGLNRLQRGGAKILGVVVNGLDFDKAQRYYGETVASTYGAYYGYGYGNTPASQEPLAPPDSTFKEAKS